MSRGFTLMEVLIVGVITIVISMIFYQCTANVNYSFSPEDLEDLGASWNPEQASAKAQQKMARELERQNDLRERELNMNKN